MKSYRDYIVCALIVVMGILAGVCLTHCVGPADAMNANFAANVACGGGEAACETPDNGDEMDEGFLDTGYELTTAWTEVLNGGTANEDFTLTSSPQPANSCSEGLQIATATAAHTYAYWNRGSAITADTPYTEYFEFQITDLTMDQYSSIYITSSGASATPTSQYNALLEVRQAGAAAYSLRAYGASQSTGPSISLDTWVIAKMTHYATAASSLLQCISGCGDANTYSFTRGANAIQYLSLGPNTGVGASEQMTMEWGYVYENTP